MDYRFDAHNLETAADETIRQLVSRILSVAPQVAQLIKDSAVLENIDVNGNQMPQKKPRPKNHPRNNPGLPCIDTGDMMDNSRWLVQQIDPTTVWIAYEPPEHFKYLIEKDPDSGGRPWMTEDRINADVRASIEEMCILAMSGDAPRGFDRQDVPEGFEVIR